MLQTAIYTSLNEQLQIDWQKLWVSHHFANMVNSPGWLIAALRAFGNKDLKIVTVYDDTSGQLLAVAPFVKQTLYGISFFTVPALEFADKPSLLVDYDHKDLTKMFLSEIAKLGNVYLTEYNQSNAQIIGEYVHHLAVSKSDLNPYLDFSVGPYGDLPSKKKNNLFNRINNSKEKVTMVNLAPDFTSAFATVIQVDQHSVKKMKGKGIFYREDVKIFYKTLEEQNKGCVQITLIYFNDKPVSYLLGFLCNGVYLGSQKAYLEGYEYYNPGKLLFIHLIDALRSKGITNIELGRGYDRFKMDFTKSYWQLYNLTISKNRLIRIYISGIYAMRKKLYEQISRHQKIYALYKQTDPFYKLFID